MVQGVFPISFDFLGILKIVFLIAIGLYGIFGLVLIKQVRIMTNTLEIALEGPIKFVSYLHFLGIIGVFIFALTTL